VSGYTLLIHIPPTHRMAKENGITNPAYSGQGNDLRSEARTSQYNDFWQKNSVNDSETDKQNRLDQYKEVVNGESRA
jgi:hypothetical protein